MMENKSIKGKNIFVFIITTLFLLFIGLYITQAMGYYEYSNNKKNTLTESAIQKFEKDIKNGKKIKVENYIEKEKNYNNLLSNVSLKLSNVIEEGFNIFMNKVFTDLSSVVNEKK